MLNVDLITVMYTSTLAKKIQTKKPKQKPQITKQNIIINKSIEKKTQTNRFFWAFSALMNTVMLIWLTIYIL